MALIKLGRRVWLICAAIMIDGVEATGDYCLGGGQLAGVVFGSILGTVAVLAALFFAFLYLRGNRAKGCPIKDAQLDTLSNEGGHSQTNYIGALAAIDSTAGCCVACGHPRSGQENDEENCDRHDNCDKTTTAGFEKVKLTKTSSGNSGEKTPNKLIGSGQSGSGYRTKKKRNSVFSSWWTHHTSAKRRVSYSTESLNSVNEVVRVTLKSRDVNGLGFNICGNLRDGILIKSLSNRGPAKESGSIHQGDRILSMTVNFENIVFEDALTIISYASAYPVTLELQKADAVPTRNRVNSGGGDGGSILNDIKSILNNSEKASSTTASKSSKILFHPLFKSQSIEDVSSFRSTSPSTFSHQIFESIDATLDARRAKTLQYSGDNSILLGNSKIVDSSKPKPVLCSLEVIEETPQLLRRSPMLPRKLADDDDAVSIDSSLGPDDAVRNENGENTSTTITVTAEINAVNCRDEEETIIIEDPYAGLSYEDRLQIIRLSYEDIDAVSRAPSESRTTTGVDEDSFRKSIEFAASPSPTFDSLIMSIENSTSRPFGDGLIENGIGELCQINVLHDDEAHHSAEDDTLSTSRDSSGPSSMESSTDRNEQFVITNSVLSKNRPNSMTSPSGSSLDASAEESDRLSSPEQSKRDSGYENANGLIGSAADDDVEKAQYEKLLYFQRQLAKQHEDLARLGIHVPMTVAPIQQPNSVGADNKRRAQNGQFTSA